MSEQAPRTEEKSLDRNSIVQSVDSRICTSSLILLIIIAFVYHSYLMRLKDDVIFKVSPAWRILIHDNEWNGRPNHLVINMKNFGISRLNVLTTSKFNIIVTHSVVHLRKLLITSLHEHILKYY